MTVAVIGASDNEDRYSYIAVSLLLHLGYDVYPVNPNLSSVLGRKAYGSVNEIPVPIDTVSIYINRSRSEAIADEILALMPRRIIFNPGAENSDLMQRARAEGIDAIEACTLVMIKTGQF